MTSTAQKITLYRGETKNIQIDVTEDGSPKAMTGCTPEWKCFSSHRNGDADAVITKTPTIEDGAGTDDRLTFTLEPSDTSSLDTGRYYHEARITTGAGAEILVMTGILEIKSSPTGG